MNRVGILYHPLNQAARTLAETIQKSLSSDSLSFWLCSAWEKEQAQAQMNGTDLVISIGGDGTILRAAQAIIPSTIPITGINLGRLGFMTELSSNDAVTKLPILFAGNGWIDERTILEARCNEEKTTRQSISYALNDVVIARGAITRLIYIATSIDGQPMTNYKADGVIIATATGSTAYSLAAGGPILHPHSSDFLLSPILPHLSPAYTLVLPATSSVRLQIATTHQASLCIDGHINQTLRDGATVTVRRSRHTARFLRIKPPDPFFNSLEQKLKVKQSENRESQN